MNDTDDRTRAGRLRAARVKAGFQSMAAFARSVGVEEATYRMHEKGDRGFDDRARDYAGKLGVSYIWLLHGDVASDDPAEARAIAADRRIAIAGLAEAGQWAETDTGDQRPAEEADRIPIEPLDTFPADAQYALRVRGESVNELVRDGGVVLCVSVHAWPGGGAIETLHGRLVHVERLHPSGFVETTLKIVDAPRGKPARLIPKSTDPRHQSAIAFEGADGVEVSIRGVAVAKFERL